MRLFAALRELADLAVLLYQHLHQSVTHEVKTHNIFEGQSLLRLLSLMRSFRQVMSTANLDIRDPP